MTYSIEHDTMAFPISSADRQQALEFAEQQITLEKRDQIYQNTLAVLVAHHYLEMLDVPSDLSNSYSWNPIAQFSGNVADLYIPEIRGRLECRPIQVKDSACFIPEEVWENRLGFVVIQLNETYTKGTLLGFVHKVSVERLPLSYLRSIEDLIDRLARPVIRPRELLNNIVDAGWQLLKSLPQSQQTLPAVRGSGSEPLGMSIEELSGAVRGSGSEPLGMSTEELSDAVRGSDSEPLGMSTEELIAILQTTQDDEERWLAAEALWESPDSSVGVKAALDLTDQFPGEPMKMIVAVLPPQNQLLPILIQVYSCKETASLPTDLRLILLDAAGNSVLEVNASGETPYVEIRRNAAIGEEFDVQVCLEDNSYIQSFVV